MSSNLEADKKSQERLSQSAEAKGLRTMYSDVQGEVSRRLTEKYGSLVPPERLQKLKDLPPVFEKRHEFDQSYKRAGGEISHKSQTTGFVNANGLESPHVVRGQEMASLGVSVAHEDLHLLSDPRSKEALGRNMYEGVTEHFAQDILNITPETLASADQNSAYVRETASAKRLCGTVGREVVENAYFKGEIQPLRVKLDEVLGKKNHESFCTEVKTWADLSDDRK